MRILIAEDDPTSRTVLMGMLGGNGYEVEAVTNGAEAWQVLQGDGAPPMAIIDWMMPEMSGPEVIRRVRALRGDLPPYIILLTSRGKKDDIIAGLKIGANDYLVKPFAEGELGARMDVGRRMIQLQERLIERAEELSKALEHIKMLHGILPICSHCKKIRNEVGRWDQLESYISQNSEARFSHSICPDCLRKHYPELQT